MDIHPVRCATFESNTTSCEGRSRPAELLQSTWRRVGRTISALSSADHARVRNTVPPGAALTFGTVPLQGLPEEQRREMAALSRAASLDRDVADYLLPRLDTYHYAITARDAEGLAAFDLIQEFEARGSRYVYLGPLFSRDGAYMPMIVDCVRGLLDSGQPFHLMTEVENPEIALAFMGLFSGTSHPSLTSSHTPGRVRTVVRTFAARLDHIHGLDAVKLSTRSTDTLYAARPLYHALERWLRLRGVRLDRGDCQVFVVSCGRSPLARWRVRRDLRHGLLEFRDWTRFRRRMLERLEEGLRRA